MLMLYTAIYMPFRIAFIDDETDALIIIDWIIDCFFFMDIIINFFSAYEEADGHMQQNLKIIAMTYIRSWFAFDFIACFPFQLLDDSKSGLDNI
jgi:potassium channel